MAYLAWIASKPGSATSFPKRNIIPQKYQPEEGKECCVGLHSQSLDQPVRVASQIDGPPAWAKAAPEASKENSVTMVADKGFESVLPIQLMHDSYLLNALSRTFGVDRCLLLFSGPIISAVVRDTEHLATQSLRLWFPSAEG
jgi:hypothetical protein